MRADRGTRPSSSRRPGGARSPEEESSHVEEAASSFDEIVSPSADEDAQEPKRRFSLLTQRRRARTTVDRPMPVADATSLLSGEEATDLGDRLRKRTRARRFLLARHIALTFVTLVLAARVVWGAFFSPVFAFSSSVVVVSGEDGTLVTVDSMRSSIAPFEGVPLTRLNTQTVVHAVESNMAVRSVSVSRRWPANLRVSVTMRTGMTVEAASGGYWLVDDQGVTFQQVPSAGDYPLVTLPEDRVTGTTSIASVLGALDEATHAQASVAMSTGAQVNFTLRDGQTAKWGARGDTPQKVRVLAALLANVQASTYDVSSSNHPVAS